MTEKTYYLRDHVFLTPTYRHCVILDVIRDRYYCVDKRDVDRLGPWLHGWQRSSQPVSDEFSAKRTEPMQLAAELVAQGFLSESPIGAKPVRPVSFTVPTSAISPCMHKLPIATLIVHTPLVLLACVAAQARLRSRSFESTVRSVAERRATAEGKRKTRAKSQTDLARLIYVFSSLRPCYPLPTASMCLFDSLALLNFLALNGIYPRWHFGVQGEPFHAHCWLQHGATVLNDTIERVSIFTPIMEV